MSTSTLNPPAPPTSPPPSTATPSSSSASAPAPAPVSVSASVPVPVQTTVQTPVQTSTNHHLHPSLNSESQRILPPPHHDSRLYNTQPNHHQQQHQHQQQQLDHKPDHLHHHHQQQQQQQQQQHPNHHQHHDQSFHPDHHHQQTHHHPNHHADQKPQLTESGNGSIYESNYLHIPPPHSNMNSQSHPNCFASNDHQGNLNNDRLKHHHHNNNGKLGTRNTISPSLSHRSTPTPSPTSSPSSPPIYNTNNGNLLDLNSIVSYSQLIQRREEVVAALKYRSGDHYAQQALDLLKAGRERVKRITAAGRAATGKPPVKHIQEQYLAVFSRFSEYCASQNIPTWPIEPVRVAIWVLAMQEKAPPTPATLRQYITRLEFTCTVTAGLFDSEFGPSSPLKASALLRELVNRDLPGQNKLKPKSPKSNKRSRSQTGGSITPPSSKKWQANHPNSAPGADPHNQHDYAISEHQQQHQHHHHPHQHHQPHYEPYLSPFGTPGTPYHPSPLGSSQPHHSHEIWPPHHPRYSTGPNTESIPSYHHHHHPHLTHHHRNEPQRSYPTFVSQPGPSSSFVAPSTSTTPTTTTTPTTSAPAQSAPRYAHPTVETNPWV